MYTIWKFKLDPGGDTVVKLPKTPYRHHFLQGIVHVFGRKVF